ncbi:hypothetical protein BN2497_11497 [Janthinobacterium sp. CG23_2]|nr:hypothetical protein BN2497_11497 [Janthinobacterium sp. CG23_2]CUU32146.1 hypothetical protein BN3177_11497 [Janthinobacterium sp. CG23_2]
MRPGRSVRQLPGGLPAPARKAIAKMPAGELLCCLGRGAICDNC